MRNRLYGLLKSTVWSAALFAFFCLFMVPAAHAADFVVEIPIETTVSGDEGSSETVARQAVGPEFRGQQCTVSSRAMNQSSVHPNSDLIVRSGGTEIVIPDVEAEPNTTIVGEGTLILGEEIVVLLHFGEDGIFSGGLVVTVNCAAGPAETGSIAVVKQVTEGSSTTATFEFSTSYGDGFFLSDGGQNDSGELAAGTYSVTEVVPDGWTLDSAVCDDGSDPASIDLAAGESVTCTFTNDEVPPDEVDAAIVVTVTGQCEVVEGEPVGAITVSIPVAGAAEIVIRDSAGEIVETFTGDGTVTVLEGQYTWEATPGEGFEFPDGFVNSGSITIVCDQVLASILVSVSAECELVGAQGIGRIAVTMSVAGGADVVVRDSNGEIVGSVSADGTITVPEGAVYTWEATLSEGFELPPGDADSGTVTIATCSNAEVLPAEVLPVEVLPFTGIASGTLAITGLVTLLMGGLIVLGARRIRVES